MRIDAKGPTATYSHTHALPAGGGVAHMDPSGARPPSPFTGFGSADGFTFEGEYGPDSVLGRRVGELERVGLVRHNEISNALSSLRELFQSQQQPQQQQQRSAI